MRELTDSVQNHMVFRDKVRVYHKFPYSERPDMGIYLKNASANRVRLSPDDYAGELKSHLAIARAQYKAGSFLEWVWEDETNLTGYERDEDLTPQITGDARIGTTRLFDVSKQIISGHHNTAFADNPGQVVLKLDGEKVLPEFVDGVNKKILAPIAPPVGSTLTVSYYYKNLTPPGRYYIEIVSDTQFDISPMYVVRKEKVIAHSTGLEMSASLQNTPVVLKFVRLYTQKQVKSEEKELIPNVEYTIDENGDITFLVPLTADTTLFADYRWIGDIIGPFDLPGDFHYVNDALPGVILAFGNELEIHDKQVLLVNENRQSSAQVYSGHWNMTFEIEVFARDPIQLTDLTDQIVDDIWTRKRDRLNTEGLVLESLEPTGEYEDVYIEGTNDQYYKNSVSMAIMTEWKRFRPFLYHIWDINISTQELIQDKEYVINNKGKLLELKLAPFTKEYDLVYPKAWFPRYI